MKAGGNNPMNLKRSAALAVLLIVGFHLRRKKSNPPYLRLYTATG